MEGLQSVEGLHLRQSKIDTDKVSSVMAHWAAIAAGLSTDCAISSLAGARASCGMKHGIVCDGM